MIDWAKIRADQREIAHKAIKDANPATIRTINGQAYWCGLPVRVIDKITPGEVRIVPMGEHAGIAWSGFATGYEYQESDVPERPAILGVDLASGKDETVVAKIDPLGVVLGAYDRLPKPTLAEINATIDAALERYHRRLDEAMAKMWYYPFVAPAEADKDPNELATVSAERIKGDKTFVRDVVNALKASGRLGEDEAYHTVTADDGSVTIRRGAAAD